MDLNGIMGLFGAISGVVGTTFGTIGWVKAAEANRIADVANAIAEDALELARKADARAEKAEQKNAISFEILATDTSGYFTFRHVGDTRAEHVCIDTSATPEIAFGRSVILGRMDPWDEYSMRMSVNEGDTFPAAVRITWARPFSGEQYVPLPARS